MTIKILLDAVYTQKEKLGMAIRYQQAFKHINRRMIEVDAKLVVDTVGTDFSDIPADVKVAMNQYWQLVKQFNTAVAADSDMVDMLEWAKPPEEIEG